MIIIALSGKLRSGKTTASLELGKIFQDRGYTAQYYSLGTYIKQIVEVVTGERMKFNKELANYYSNEDTSDMFDFDGVDKASVSKECGIDNTMSIGEWCQLIGARAKKVHGDGIIATKLLERINCEGCHFAVIDGVRHKEDLIGICQAFGDDNVYSVRLEADHSDKEPEDGRDRNHASETALDNYDFDYPILSNDFPIDWDYIIDDIIQDNKQFM